MARQRGSIQWLPTVAGQQTHILLRVVHLRGRLLLLRLLLLAIVSHIVNVAELGEGVGGLVHCTGHLELLYGAAGGAGATTTTPTPQLRRGGASS